MALTPDGPGRCAGLIGDPATSEAGGRGIWLAYQLCDEVTICNEAVGATIVPGFTLTGV